MLTCLVCSSDRPFSKGSSFRTARSVSTEKTSSAIFRTGPRSLSNGPRAADRVAWRGIVGQRLWRRQSKQSKVGSCGEADPHRSRRYEAPCGWIYLRTLWSKKKRSTGEADQLRYATTSRISNHFSVILQMAVAGSGATWLLRLTWCRLEDAFLACNTPPPTTQYRGFISFGRLIDFFLHPQPIRKMDYIQWNLTRMRAFSMISFAVWQSIFIF